MRSAILFRFFLVPGSAAFLTGCALSANVNSQYVSGERVALRPAEEDAIGLLPVGGIAAALAPKVITFAAGKLREHYARESEKYVASYNATLVGDDFYKSDSNLEFSYDVLEIKRYATEKSTGQEAAVSSIKLRWVTNAEHTLFALQPEVVYVQKAKAKLRTGDKTLDLSIRVVLDGYWQVKNGEVKSKSLGDATMVLKNITLGETYIMGGDDQQTWLQDTNGHKSNYNVQTPWIPPVPVSVSDQGNPLEHARGNYSLTVAVTEIDDYGERVARLGNDMYDARGILIELLEGVE